MSLLGESPTCGVPTLGTKSTRGRVRVSQKLSRQNARPEAPWVWQGTSCRASITRKKRRGLLDGGDFAIDGEPLAMGVTVVEDERSRLPRMIDRAFVVAVAGENAPSMSFEGVGSVTPELFEDVLRFRVGFVLPTLLKRRLKLGHGVTTAIEKDPPHALEKAAETWPRSDHRHRERFVATTLGKEMTESRRARHARSRSI